MNVKLIRHKKRTKFYIGRGNQLLNMIIDEMPEPGEGFKIISPEDGFSAINIILFVLEREEIQNLYVSSLCIGKKESGILSENGKNGYIKNAFLCVGNIMKSNRKYDYWKYLCNVAEGLNWTIKTIKNHSKIILMETEKNYYVIETSANLNKNPQVEFFNIENNKESFLFYKTFFEEVIE